MKNFRVSVALVLCAVCLLGLCSSAFAAQDAPTFDVSGKTLTELLDAFRAEHDLNEENFALSYYNTVTGESLDYNETAFFYGASTYKLPLNLYYYDMQLDGQITGDTMIAPGVSLNEAHYQSLVYSNNELSKILWQRIGDWPEYKRALQKYFTMTDDEIPQSYYYNHLFCTRMMMDTLKVIWDGQDRYTELIDDLKLACPDAYFKTYLDVEQTPIAHKYGSYEGAENDVGIIWAEQPFLLAVYTSGLAYGAGGNVDLSYADGQSAGSVICGQLAALFRTYIEEQRRLAQEQAEKEAEEARLAAEAAAEAEAQARLEAEQKAAAEQVAAEQAELQRQAAEAEAQARQAEEQARQQAAHRQRTLRLICAGAGCLLIGLLAALLIQKLRKAKIA